MNLVIGSGPSGVACAQALLACGERVLLLDAGIRIEPGQQNLLLRIGEGDPDALEQLTHLQANVPVSAEGISHKLAHGSDFPYRGAAEHLGFDGIETGLAPSLAFGGLSNVWGAAVMPYRQHDIADWPIGVHDLAPHYEAALKITGVAAQRDDLAHAFPLYAEPIRHLNLSAQAHRMQTGLDGIRAALQRDGISYGASRLTVNAATVGGCVYCGQCLQGCPFGLIYNSARTVERMLIDFGSTFAYQGDVVVDRIDEETASVRITAHDRTSNAPLHFEADRVFLATGVIPSSRILLKSLDAYAHPLTVRDSQYFILPVLAAREERNVESERLHTLSQLFLEIQDEKISPYTIHLQVYTYNDLLARVLTRKLWFAPGLRRLLVGAMARRLLVIQGYLHSAHSGTMTLRLTRAPHSGKERLAVKGNTSTDAAGIIAQISRKLARHFRRLGLAPLAPAVDITAPGRGFHSGGSFPMRTSPREFEADTLGRVNGLRRVHVVDATAFPSIPATTITLTAMANAHRIGSDWKAPS